jgi:hypothetical protein
MAQTEAKRLRLFTTLGRGPPGAPSSAVGPAPETARRLEVVASSSNKWSPFYSFSTRHDMPTTSLLLHCIALGHSSAAQLTGFDAEGGMDGRDGQLAAAFAEHLVGGWRHLSYTPGWRWHLQVCASICPPRSDSQPCTISPPFSKTETTHRLLLTCPCLQNVLESPCFGVPGLCTYNAARAAWIRQQVHAAVEGDSCRQVVVLRAGWSTWSHSLAQPGVQVRTARHASAAIQSVPICPSTVALLPAGREVAVGGRAAIVTADPASIVPPNRCSDVPCALFVTSPPFQFYEVDSRQAVQRKKEALDALLPGWRRAARRPRFVEGERARAVWQAVEGLLEALHTTSRLALLHPGP